MLDDPVDGVLTDGTCTWGVLTLGTDGVLTCGTDGTDGTEGVVTGGTDGVLTCGTCGTGTDASGVCGSWTWVWSWRTETPLSALVSTPCAELAIGTTDRKSVV